MTKVLIIEDNACDAYILEKLCREAGFSGDFCVAPGAHQARGILYRSGVKGEAFRPDVVLLDLGLPGVNGHEILQEIRSHRETLELPVVILTSSDNPADRDAAIECGATLYLTKPFDLDGFREVVNRLVNDEFPKLSTQLQPMQSL